MCKQALDSAQVREGLKDALLGPGEPLGGIEAKARKKRRGDDTPMTTSLTIWIAYNTDDKCFASHVGSQEAIEGLMEDYGHGEGTRVVEMKLRLPSIAPLTVQAEVPDRDGPVSVTIE